MTTMSFPDIYNLVEGVIDGKVPLSDVEAALENPALAIELLAPSLLDVDTPLMCAVRAQNLQFAKLLLDAKAQPDITDTKGVAPIHIAVFDGSVEMIELLVSARADVNLRDRYGHTPMFFAPNGGICDILRAAGADVNALNHKGQSALHLAAHAGLNDTVLFLASALKPSLVNAQDRHGRTAMFCAAHSNLRSTIVLLREKGADPLLRPLKYKKKAQAPIEDYLGPLAPSLTATLLPASRSFSYSDKAATVLPPVMKAIDALRELLDDSSDDETPAEVSPTTQFGNPFMTHFSVCPSAYWKKLHRRFDVGRPMQEAVGQLGQIESQDDSPCDVKETTRSRKSRQSEEKKLELARRRIEAKIALEDEKRAMLKSEQDLKKKMEEFARQQALERSRQTAIEDCRAKIKIEEARQNAAIAKSEALRRMAEEAERTAQLLAEKTKRLRQVEEARRAAEAVVREQAERLGRAEAAKKHAETKQMRSLGQSKQGFVVDEQKEYSRQLPALDEPKSVLGAKAKSSTLEEVETKPGEVDAPRVEESPMAVEGKVFDNVGGGTGTSDSFDAANISSGVDASTSNERAVADAKAIQAAKAAVEAKAAEEFATYYKHKRDAAASSSKAAAAGIHGRSAEKVVRAAPAVEAAGDPTARPKSADKPNTKQKVEAAEAGETIGEVVVPEKIVAVLPVQNLASSGGSWGVAVVAAGEEMRAEGVEKPHFVDKAEHRAALCAKPEEVYEREAADDVGRGGLALEALEAVAGTSAQPMGAEEVTSDLRKVDTIGGESTNIAADVATASPIATRTDARPNISESTDQATIAFTSETLQSASMSNARVPKKSFAASLASALARSSTAKAVESQKVEAEAVAVVENARARVRPLHPDLDLEAGSVVSESLKEKASTQVSPQASEGSRSMLFQKVQSHAASDVPCTEIDECRIWEVELSKQDDTQKFGFGFESGKVAFLQERYRKLVLVEVGGDQPLAKVEKSSREAPIGWDNLPGAPLEDHSPVARSPKACSDPPGPEVLRVKRITGGLLQDWNRAHPGNEVRFSDRIIEVNGKAIIKEMKNELSKSATVKLKVMRYAGVFEVELQKRESKPKLGFRFEKPSGAALHEVKITEVSKDGLLDEANDQLIAQGKFHKVVCPGMRIIQVNEVRGTDTVLAEELRRVGFGTVRLRIRRHEAVAEEKMDQVMDKLKIVNAFKAAGSRSRG